MPLSSWSEKREGPYEHLKEGLVDRRDSDHVADESGAHRQQRARRAGEAKQTNRGSPDDLSSGRRGGCALIEGPVGRTRDQIYEEARRKGVKGRSKMSETQLQRSLGR
jgi:hypothetical protein